MHKITIASVLAAAQFGASADSQYWNVSENIAGTSLGCGIDPPIAFLPYADFNNAVQDQIQSAEVGELRG